MYREISRAYYAYEVVCTNDRFIKSVVICRDKNIVYSSIEVVLNESKYCRKILNEYLNKRFTMTIDDERGL